MRICPTCPSTLTEPFEMDFATTVDLCGTCRGMFLEADAVRTVCTSSLVALTTPMPIDLDFRQALRCPACHQDMSGRSLAAAREASVWICDACQGAWLKEGVLSRLRAEHDKRQRVRKSAMTLDLHALKDSDEGLAFARLQFDGPFANLGALPVVFLLALLFYQTTLGRLLSWLIGMPVHELGHAVVSWLSSQVAVPLPFVTFHVVGKSWVVGLLVAGVLVYTMWHGWREKRYFVVVLGGVFLLVQMLLTFFVPFTRLMAWQTLGGQLGEIAFSALALVAFYFKFPDRIRWDFWRWPALLPAAVCLLRARHVWARAATNLADIPWGAALGAENDGDMNRMVNDYGWTATELASFYGTAVYLALGVVFFVYAFFAVQFVKTHRYRARAAD